MKAVVNTSKVAGRRVLGFASLDELLSEARRCAASEQAGTLRVLGNWPLGKTLGHLAFWIDASFDGIPFVPPWYMKMVGPLIKRKLIKGPMPTGVRFPGAAEGTFGTTVYATAEGLARLEAAVGRLKAGVPARPHPVFGAMTREEWTGLHLRHSEMHLGFMIPGPR